MNANIRKQLDQDEWFRTMKTRLINLRGQFETLMLRADQRHKKETDRLKRIQHETARDCFERAGEVVQAELELVMDEWCIYQSDQQRRT